MKSLAALLILALIVISAHGADQEASGPALEVSSLSGRLQLDLPSTLTVELRNNASYPPGAEGFDSQRRDAMGIVAELFSSDRRIIVLSAPQPAGTLGPGESRNLEFTALATDAEAGVYPLQLRLSYIQLSGIATSGDQSIPDVLFSYENFTAEIPLQASVVLGPRINAEETRGDAYPGKDSELQLIFANRGDEPTVHLRVDGRSYPPFRVTDASGEEMRLEPGGSGNARLRVFTDNATAPGYYALPYLIFYEDGNRSSEGAALVYVQADSPWAWLLLPAGIMLLAGAAWGARRRLQGKRGNKRKRRLRG